MPQRPRSRRDRQAERVDLKDAKDGSGDLLYEANGFTRAHRARRQRLLQDKRRPGLSVFPWLPSKAPLGRAVAAGVVAEPAGGPRRPPARRRVDDRPAAARDDAVIPEVSRYRPDPREDCRDCPASASRCRRAARWSPARIRAATSPTRSSASRARIPNRYQKAAFLAATHDRRIEMAVKTHARLRPARVRRAARAPAGDRLRRRLSYRERRAILAALAPRDGHDDARRRQRRRRRSTTSSGATMRATSPARRGRHESTCAGYFFGTWQSDAELMQ